MNGSNFRVWSPPGSDFRIEYSNALLRDVRIMQAGQRDISGLLYGARANGTIRVVAARATADTPDRLDPRLSGLDLIGMFASRLRGEVFLTESDLEQFEKLESGAVVALVVAGTNAGFFVHEHDGSLQSIKSHLEFSAAETAPGVDPQQDVEPPKLSPPGASRMGWGMRAVAIGALAVAIGFAAPRIARSALILQVGALPRSRPPVALTVREHAGALQIGWTPAALSAPAMLDIQDGAEHTSVAAASLASLTYVRRTGDVEVQLGGESAHFLGSDPPVPRINRVREQVAELDAEARDLESTAAIRNRRVAELEKILSKMGLAH
jgi:hypothetical protein